ncbi:MAG: methionine--tRNA ligase [Gammaproteobacteria bacterium]|nr:methionine--tRNA ligase [Gammaproteobacteria bacterium]
MRRILVTAALPYSNGSIHLGHLLEQIQTDIWVRFQKLYGNECYYFCADDAHGTATMLSAEEAGVSKEEWISRLREEHIKDLQAFGVDHENYYSTHSPENEKLTQEIYLKLLENGAIFTDEVSQLYDSSKELFLADRYVRGKCPRCGAEDQPGDNCDMCGATYAATDLIEPRSVHSDSKPVLKSSTHYFFDLAQFTSFLREWTTSGTVREDVSNKLKEWLESGLKPWDISRDAPYFGFQIPETSNKYFYVWLDAPIGYMASFRNWCDRSGVEFDDFWKPGNDTEVHHFIGKDIVNFHALFWPAVLKCSGFRTPTRIHVHGYITVDGEKMSKSKGTFIKAETYSEFLDPETLRYYYAARLTPTINDIDFSFADFLARVNSDLVGKLVNIPSRCANFLARGFDSQLSTELSEPSLFEEFAASKASIEQLYELGDTAQVVRAVMSLADKANQYIASNPPWELAKQEGKEQELQNTCTLAINLFRTLCVYLKPIVPMLVERSEQFLNSEPLTWNDVDEPLLDHRLGKFKRLMNRIDQKQIDKLIEASKETSAIEPESDEDQITIEDFQKIDLRVAEILDARFVDGADSLLELKLKVGTGERIVFAGIRTAYDPEKLKGRHVVVVANLKPRKMRFGTSEGMVLAAGPGGSDIFLVSPDDGALSGMEVR